MENNIKTYFIFLSILAVFAIVVFSLPTMLPIMDDDEYFIDNNGYIHENDCPLRKNPWFTRKYSKYDILIEEDQEICGECLSFEKDKLFMLHRINLKEEILRLKRAGATEEYISDKMMKYRTK